MTNSPSLYKKTPAHCGQWDSYRRRGFNPHYVNGDNQTITITDKSSSEYQAYDKAFVFNESLGDYKDYS